MSDDDSCDEVTDDEVIAVVNGDDGKTVSDVEDEEQHIEELIMYYYYHLIKNRTRSGRIVRRDNDTWTYLSRYVLISNNGDYPLTGREGFKCQPIVFGLEF